MLGFSLLREFCTNMEKTHIMMKVAIAALPTDAVLNYILTEGVWKFPKLGMFGIGLASTIVQYLMFAAMLVHILSNAPKDLFL